MMKDQYDLGGRPGMKTIFNHFSFFPPHKRHHSGLPSGFHDQNFDVMFNRVLIDQCRQLGLRVTYVMLGEDDRVLGKEECLD